MGIPIWSTKTGSVFLRSFDQGIMDTLGAVPDPGDVNNPCHKLMIDFGNGVPVPIPVYFTQPEPIFKKKIFPFITVNRDDISPDMARWMSLGNLEYRAGVSGTYVSGTDKYLQYESKMQAFPYDLVYTISVWDRYESPVQTTLLKVLKAFSPIGKLIVYDSLEQLRSYEYFHEGSIVSLQEVVDPDTRARGYALTIRVVGELDLVDTSSSDTVTGIDLFIYRF